MAMLNCRQRDGEDWKDEADDAHAPDAVNRRRDGAAELSVRLPIGLGAEEPKVPACAVARRRAEIRPRFQEFRLGQSRRAEGRHAAPVGRRHVRHAEPVFRSRASRPRVSDLIYDSLFTPSPDEPSTQYGLIAECASYPDDYSSVTFKLRPEAKFHDGQPITPDDVIFSFDAVQEGQSVLRLLLQERHQGRKDRRPRGDVHVRRRKAIASCR